MRDKFSGNVALLGGIFLIESLAVFTQVLSDLLLLILGQQSLGSRTPQELLELVKLVAREILSLEVPDGVSRFGLRKKSAKNHQKEDLTLQSFGKHWPRT